MRRMTFPLLKPALFSRWVLLVVTFMRELGLVLFLYRPGSETLSVAAYQLRVGGQLPLAATIAVIRVALIAVVAAVGRLVAGVSVGAGQ